MPKGITEEQVHEAADTLLEAGQRPTIERVRQKLERGSPNTVNRYLDTWWRSLSDRMKGTAKGKMPADVVRLAGRLWALALAAARKELSGAVTDETQRAPSFSSLEKQLADLRRLLQAQGIRHRSKPRGKRNDKRRRRAASAN